MKFVVAVVLLAVLVAMVSGAAFPGPRPPASPREALAGSESVYYPYAYAYPAYSYPVVYWG